MLPEGVNTKDDVADTSKLHVCVKKNDYISTEIESHIVDKKRTWSVAALNVGMSVRFLLLLDFTRANPVQVAVRHHIE